MTTFRVTQNMLSRGSLAGLQGSLTRLAQTQEQLSTGRVLNRPSDSPTDTTAAMRLRASIADRQQFARNAGDGIGWLGLIDSTLTTMSDQVRRARELGLQGANTGAMSATGRDALATEVDQLRESLLQQANATYIDRPVFGGVTSGKQAYDASGAFVGETGAVVRTVADGVRVRVDLDGRDVFGPDGASLFDDLAALSTALRAGDADGINAGVERLGAGLDRLGDGLATVGARYAQVERAQVAAGDAELQLRSNLSELENVDVAEAVVDLQMQEMAYQAALGATARVMQPSLLDFLR